jgi:sterol desaturase/sphingolipid hydroxylase (fatty acid hydroxylase superfamily)
MPPTTLAQIKTTAAQWLGPVYEPLVYLSYALFPFGGAHVLNGTFILSALLLAAWLYRSETRRPGTPSLGGFARFVMPSAVFWHPSARVDYRFYLVNAVFLSYVRLSVRVSGFVSLLHVSDVVRSWCQGVIGSAAGSPGLPAQVLYTLALVLALDFAKFLAHFLQHKVPVLWEFHKVHHSAEVLTPVTNFRLHPVDVIVEQFLAALAGGLVVGVFASMYPAGVAELTILNIGAIHFFYFLAANLRHSHIPLHFGWRLSHVFSSPYMHQLHHSSEARHWDRNYALIFSFWDWLFRCLYVPRGREQFKLGLSGPPTSDFDAAWKLYVMPFRNAWRRIATRSLGGAPANALRQKG